MAIPLIFKRIAIIFLYSGHKAKISLVKKKEDDYFLVTLLCIDTAIQFVYMYCTIPNGLYLTTLCRDNSIRPYE